MDLRSSPVAEGEAKLLGDLRFAAVRFAEPSIVVRPDTWPSIFAAPLTARPMGLSVAAAMMSGSAMPGPSPLPHRPESAKAFGRHQIALDLCSQAGRAGAEAERDALGDAALVDRRRS